MQYVFVYGTLRAGEINDINRAAERSGIAAPQWIGTAHVRGRLYDFGAYPGLVLDEEGGTPVKGDVYRIEDALVAVLDEIEEVYPGVEGLFRAHRLHVDVELDGEATHVDCLIYPVAASAVQELPRIEGGDWVAHRAARA
ncbi:gamma-glutamylcyclotransferase [Caballeronia sp. M1242]|uniref:gamma-glutamylcyclotransferase family protein n=1 Tax=Caballeronia sp. M1242 TaxID=2814653 RepID=UPI0019CF6972|nr:gamma-glutamylcyclotransferase family protein [Caballeronia sp. M1242]QSN60266.1 gamma-glutamylcyclotransferase [Caballeronia sp. M1242]